MKRMIKKIINRLSYHSYGFTNWLINFELKHFPSIAVKHLKKKKVITGNEIIIKKGVFIEKYKNVEIGNGCAINSYVKFYIEGGSTAKIILGNNVAVARDVRFETGTHEIGNSEKRMGKTFCKTIDVGNGSWIGIGSIILPGVKIGEGCIIQAGSVVTKNCKPNCIYGGNPAKKLVDLSEFKE